VFVVNYENELRDAFAAGRASMMPLLTKRVKWGDTQNPFANVPRTYEEWIESQRHRPQVARG
jgi:hypothetical protein